MLSNNNKTVGQFGRGALPEPWPPMLKTAPSLAPAYKPLPFSTPTHPRSVNQSASAFSTLFMEVDKKIISTPKPSRLRSGVLYQQEQYQSRRKPTGTTLTAASLQKKMEDVRGAKRYEELLKKREAQEQSQYRFERNTYLLGSGQHADEALTEQEKAQQEEHLLQQRKYRLDAYNNSGDKARGEEMRSIQMLNMSHKMQWCPAPSPAPSMRNPAAVSAPLPLASSLPFPVPAILEAMPDSEAGITSLI